MKDLKESFKIKTDENLQETIINSGKKLNWKPVSISDNEVEFQYTTHLTKFYTVVSWSIDGFVNLSSNYKRKSIKVDIGGYRNNNNEKIKLSILREVELKTKKDIPNDIKNSEKVLSSNNSDNIETEDTIDISKNKKHENYSELISKKDKSQKIKLVVIALVVIGGILVYNISNSVSACDCANLYDNSTMNRNYTAKQLNDRDFLQRKADKQVKKAKKCAIKFGNLTDIEKELAKSVLQMRMIPKLRKAVDNAKKECGS